MKTILLGATALLFSININAQSKNVKSEVTTKITTIKDSEGEKKMIKTQEINENQEIQLMDAESSILNKNTKETPINVTATTKITADGVTRLIDVDRSAYYELDGQKYQVAIDKIGYTMTFANGQKKAILRKTSNNNYIYKDNESTAYGYFDDKGNLVLENYKEGSDTITTTTYILNK